MNYQLDIAALAAKIRAKRAGRPLRALAKEVGNISPATLSRVEREAAPDLPTLLLLCNWLELPPADVLRDLHHVAPPCPAPHATATELTNIELFLGLTPTLAFTTPSPSEMEAAFFVLRAQAEAEIEAIFATSNF
jgi:transcriptional regulator with XRE-family HTH domain